jgi:hypothetical protein
LETKIVKNILTDPRWEAIGVLVAIYALVIGGLATVQGLKEFLMGTLLGILLFIFLLLLPVVVLAVWWYSKSPRRPRLSRKDRSAIKEIILRHNQDFAKAVNQQDPRFLWETVTNDAYLTFVEKRYEKLVNSLLQHAATLKLYSADFITISATEAGKAVARVDETWMYSFAQGGQTASAVHNRYTLQKTGEYWLIDRAELFILQPE